MLRPCLGRTDWHWSRIFNDVMMSLPDLQKKPQPKVCGIMGTFPAWQITGKILRYRLRIVS